MRLDNITTADTAREVFVRKSAIVLGSMKILLTLTLLFFIVPTFGQKPAPCDLTIKDSPTARGLKLGMSEEDFKKVLDAIPSADGSYHVFTSEPASNLHGVMWIKFKFYKQRLYYFQIAYDNSVKWENVDQFAEAISESLKLPLGAWTTGKSYASTMECKDFDVEIRNSILASIEFTDKLAVAEMEAEQRHKEAEKRRTFKP